MNTKVKSVVRIDLGEAGRGKGARIGRNTVKDSSDSIHGDHNLGLVLV